MGRNPPSRRAGAAGHRRLTSEGFQVYSIDTPADAIATGDVVLETAYGEPSGTLLTGRNKTQLKRWQIHDGWVVAWRIEAPQ